MGHLFAFGLGYSARTIAKVLAGEGWSISGTSRDADGAAAIAGLGYAAHVFDGHAPATSVRPALATATHVLVSAPPDGEGDPVLRHHRADLTGARLRWIGYLSTVGVYGDRQGGWVDEETEPRPMSERSRRRLAAEQAWLSFGATAGCRVEVFRIAGIYGPGRSAVDAVIRGTAHRIVKPGQVFNRIHVEDLARAIIKSMQSERSAYRIYNLADNEPAPHEDVVAYAAGLLGLPAPEAVPFEEANLTPMGRSFYAENKRVSNARIKDALEFDFLYPSYREGLAAIASGRK